MQITARQLTALRSAAKKAVGAASKADLNLSQMVWETRNARLRGQPDIRPWQHWGFESWEEYLKIELQMSPGTAVSHLRIWEVFGIALKGKWSVKKVLPHSKMAILSMMALNVPNVDALLDNCRTKSVAEIKAMVRSGVFTRKIKHIVSSTLTATQDWLDEYLQHISTIRLALGPLSRAEVVLEALRYFVKNHPSIRRLKPKIPKTNQPPSQAKGSHPGSAKGSKSRTTKKKGKK